MLIGCGQLGADDARGVLRRILLRLLEARVERLQEAQGFANLRERAGDRGVGCLRRRQGGQQQSEHGFFAALQRGVDLNAADLMLGEPRGPVAASGVAGGGARSGIRGVRE